jgi:hypothetical protein
VASSPPVPLSFRVSAHLLRPGASRVSRSSRLARRLSWGLLPFSVCGAGSPLAPGLCLPRFVPPSRFLPSRRVSPRLSSQVCFTLERSWDSPFRAFPSGRSEPLSERLPLVPLPPRAIHGWCARTPHPGEAILRGPASGGSSLPESVRWYPGVSRLPGRCSPGLFLSRDFSRVAARLPFGSAPLSRLTASPFVGCSSRSTARLA